jgi:hypothetical protein
MESNSVRTMNRRKYNLIGQISHNNCLKGHDIAWEKRVCLEVTRRRRKRRKQLLDDIMERRGCWELSKQKITVFVEPVLEEAKGLS